MIRGSAWREQTAARFWIAQASVWSAYGIMLMLPWIGVYSIAVMIPNKLAIAGTGLATSAVLRLIYKEARARRVGPDKLMIIAAGASAVGGLVWSGWSAAMIGADVAALWRSAGTLSAGIPHLGGPLYSTLVLLAWSLGYLVLTTPSTTAPLRQAVRVMERGATDGIITARDGDKTVLIESRELAWIQADGDYVRLHTDGKSRLIRTTMTKLESTLPAAEYVRIHRSTIVNVARVREVVPRANAELVVVMKDGTKLKASRSYANRLRKTLGLREHGPNENAR